MSQTITLDDKYVLESGRVYLTGTQALVRLPLMQAARLIVALAVVAALALLVYWLLGQSR